RAIAASSRLSAATMSTGWPSLCIALLISPCPSAPDVAMFVEPVDGPRERGFNRVLRQAKLARRFRGIEPHTVARHLDAFDRHVRLAAGDVDGPEVFQARISFGDPVRHLHARRWNVGYTSERVEHLLERQVGAAENIAFARAPAFAGKDVAFGAVTHVYQVHACVNVTEHFALEKIADDLAG